MARSSATTELVRTACVCIVDRARGGAVSQAGLAARWTGSRKGFELADAAPALSAQYFPLNPDDPRNIRALRAYLVDSALIIAQMFAPRLDTFYQRMVPPPTSPHGRLCALPFGRFHAVVLIGFDESGFWYLDPFFQAVRQPFWIGEDDFVTAFQGAVVVAGI